MRKALAREEFAEHFKAAHLVCQYTSIGGYRHTHAHTPTHININTNVSNHILGMSYGTPMRELCHASE